jgi:hypothetical protein
VPQRHHDGANDDRRDPAASSYAPARRTRTVRRLPRRLDACDGPGWPELVPGSHDARWSPDSRDYSGSVSPRPRWVTAPFHPGDIRHSPSGSGRLGCHHEFLSRSSGPPAGSTGPPPAPRRLSPSGGRSISHAGSADHPVGWYARGIQSSVRLAGRSRTPRRVPAGRAGSLSLGLRVGSGSASGVAGIFGADPVDVLLAWVVARRPRRRRDGI